jgi:hypothetical protein
MADITISQGTIKSFTLVSPDKRESTVEIETRYVPVPIQLTPEECVKGISSHGSYWVVSYCSTKIRAFFTWNWLTPMTSLPSIEEVCGTIINLTAC